MSDDVKDVTVGLIPSLHGTLRDLATLFLHSVIAGVSVTILSFRPNPIIPPFVSIR